MNKDYYKPYEGRDIKILDQHAANTIAEDHLTFPYQLLDHLAHVLMLKEQGIISQEDAAQILGAVLKLRREGPDIVPHKPGLTDLYSNVEEWVIAQVGIQVGGKMHTGRSRNDMNPAIERMYIRRKLLEQMEAITFLMETLLVQAEVHKNTIIPAYTHHSQQAQPITLGHFYMSAFENFGRDMERLMRAYEHVDLSPMGAAAVATTGFPISRERVAELLGFHGMLVNSMDATSTLDYAYEPACAMAIFINNVGRVTESLLLWNLNEVGISRLALPYCSYSTIMPQKRNPVALETLRYSGEWTYGTLSSMFNTMKAYPPETVGSPAWWWGSSSRSCSVSPTVRSCWRASSAIWRWTCPAHWRSSATDSAPSPIWLTRWCAAWVCPLPRPRRSWDGWWSLPTTRASPARRSTPRWWRAPPRKCWTST